MSLHTSTFLMMLSQELLWNTVLMQIILCASYKLNFCGNEGQGT
jgi:hypothetical protein